MYNYFLIICVNRNLLSFNYKIVNYTSIIFLLKRMWNIFLLHTYCTIKFVHMIVPSIVAEMLYQDIFRMICCIYFRYGSIVFHKQRLPAKISAAKHCSLNKTEYLCNTMKMWRCMLTSHKEQVRNYSSEILQLQMQLKLLNPSK